MPVFQPQWLLLSLLGGLEFRCMSCARDSLRTVQDWLATKGSPHSVIERAEFKNERQLEALEYKDFAVRRR
jgi:hypothetical protein